MGLIQKYGRFLRANFGALSLDTVLNEITTAPVVIYDLGLEGVNADFCAKRKAAEVNSKRPFSNYKPTA
jgi:hypothetical protein